MKHIKLFENFNKSDLEKELNKYDIENYTINEDGTIDVDGDVDLSNNFLKQKQVLFKIPFKFGKVSGDFNCSYNNLESLEGSPYYVGGNFVCIKNKLTSLNGSPSEVGGYFSCSYNKLKSLEGMTLEIGDDFYCKRNPDLKELDSVSNIEGILFCDKEVDISKFKGYCKEFDIE